MQTICSSLQTDNHTNTSSLNFYSPDALPDPPTNSVKALKAHGIKGMVKKVNKKSKKGKGSPYSITKHMVPEMIPALGSQPAGDVSRKPGGRLPLLSARPSVTPTTLKRAATNFAAW